MNSYSQSRDRDLASTTVDILGICGNLLNVRVSIGNGGWVCVDDVDLPGPLYVRFRDFGGRLRPVEVYLDASQGTSAVTAQDLRQLPLGEVEAVANQDPGSTLGVANRMNFPAPDLSTLASYYASWFAGNMETEIARGNWVALAFASQHIDPGRNADRTPDLDLPVKRVRRSPDPGARYRSPATGYRLAAGPTAGLTDDFLRDVARAYASAVARGEPPNRAIASQTGYPLKTVQRWVYTARLRGIMPPGRKGAAG